MSQRERIIEQSMQMFVAQGIKSVRMDDIAQQLGVSKRTLYELFGGGKDELLYEAMHFFFEQHHTEIEQLVDQAPNVLEAIFIQLNHVMDQAEISGRMMNNLKKFYPQIYDRLMCSGREEHRLRFRSMLEQGIADGLFIPEINVDLAIGVLYYTASALMMRKELVIPEGMTERDAFIQTMTTFLRGISTLRGSQLVADYLNRYKLGKEIVNNS